MTAIGLRPSRVPKAIKAFTLRLILEIRLLPQSRTREFAGNITWPVSMARTTVRQRRQDSGGQGVSDTAGPAAMSEPLPLRPDAVPDGPGG